MFLGEYQMLAGGLNPLINKQKKTAAKWLNYISKVDVDTSQ